MNGLQNRKTVAVLIVLAAGLWGGILWRLVRYTGGKRSLPHIRRLPRLIR